MLEQIKQFFGAYWQNLRNNTEITSVDPAEMKTMLNELCEHNELLDEKYRTCDYKQMKNIVSIIPSKSRVYISQDRDCEDFAWEFKAIAKSVFPNLPIGYVHVETPQGKHAMNCCFYYSGNNLRFALIEPQTGKMYNSIANYEPYLILI